MEYILALNAGHGLYTPGKRCDANLDPSETREWWLNDRICDKIETMLASYTGIKVVRIDDTTGKTDIPLQDRTDKANKLKADFYLAIHANAGIYGGSGGGITAFVYLTVDKETLSWQQELYTELIRLTGLIGNRANPMPKANLHEVRETSMPAVLLELGFMDSRVDVPIILTDAFATKCASACVSVIVKKWNLKKAESSKEASKYRLVTDVNKYSTAADAKAQTNAKSDKMKAGTYYILAKYPEGYNGMYNLTTDPAGIEAGSWINPIENKVVEPEETVQKLYRVRKSKDDAKTQKGAYSSLDNAKTACQAAGEGYHVFDWNFNIVYSYTAPVKPEEPKVEPTPTPTPTPTPAVKNVYDLDFPIKTKIVDSDVVQTEGINEEDCTQAIVAITKNNPDFDANIAKAFFLLADEYHINPMMAISQSVLETGWFKYNGSAVKPEHHNYCGLGVTSNGIEGGKFDTIENGVRAQLQHLYAYGCKDALPDGETTVVDPRFKYVTRGIAEYWQQLAGRWAVPGYDKNTYSTPEAAMKAENTYGQKILNICKQLENTKVTESDIRKYFNVDEPKVEPVNPKDDDKGIDTDKVNILLDVFIKLIELIINWFKKKQ